MFLIHVTPKCSTRPFLILKDAEDRSGVAIFEERPHCVRDSFEKGLFLADYYASYPRIFCEKGDKSCIILEAQKGYEISIFEPHCYAYLHISKIPVRISTLNFGQRVTTPRLVLIPSRSWCKRKIIFGTPSNVTCNSNSFKPRGWRPLLVSEVITCL